MTIVKICGLQTVEHARVAAEAGADMLGFVFAPSRRQVRPAWVATITTELRALEPFRGRRSPELVGVFVNESAQHMASLAYACGLDTLQLSGDEDRAITEQLPHALIKAVRLGEGGAEAAWLRNTREARVRLLVDANVPGSYGGAGVVADWDRAAELARGHPLLLAGGLTPDNVAEAIRRVRPWGVDVSSGVETGGVKDSAKIRAFVAAVRLVDKEITGR